MSMFLRRVHRLYERLQVKKHPPVILTYRDGLIREMSFMDALNEIGGGADVVDVKYPDKTGESLLAAMLPGIENGEKLLDGIDELEPFI